MSQRDPHKKGSEQELQVRASRKDKRRYLAKVKKARRGTLLLPKATIARPESRAKRIAKRKIQKLSRRRNRA